jgi:hypothetical protein
VLISKRSRRGHPVADRVRTLLKLGGVANLNAVRGQMFVVFVDDVALKAARALGLQQQELDADEAVAAVAGALIASQGFVSRGRAVRQLLAQPAVAGRGAAGRPKACASLVP